MTDLLAFLSTGLLDMSTVGYVIVVLALSHVTIMATTIYLHRCQAHRSVDLHPAVAHAFRFWLWLTTGMRTIEWVAVHRKHHTHTESEEDPHSPHQTGIWKVLLEGQELYRAEAANPETLAKYGHGCPDDWIERNLYTRFKSGGIAVLGALMLILFGVIGLTIWALLMIWIPLWAAGVINGIGHYIGYRNFEPEDGSTNIVPFGILVGGEELHNNHHAFPSSARLSQRWYEFDLGWTYLRVLSSLGLARIKRVAPRATFDPTRTCIDADTARAVLVARMHVLRRYARNVTRPVLRQEIRRAGTSCRHQLRRARRALVCNESRVGTAELAERDRALALSAAVRTVHDYHRRLRELFTIRGGMGPERLVASLQEWCAQAEASGIECLERFAAELRGYRLAT